MASFTHLAGAATLASPAAGAVPADVRSTCTATSALQARTAVKAAAAPCARSITYGIPTSAVLTLPALAVFCHAEATRVA